MSTQFRDTEFGHLIRVLSRNRLLRYPDEIEPVHSHKVLQREYGNRKREVVEHAATAASNNRSGPYESLSSNATIIVDWYIVDDPENPQNWPSHRKVLTALQINLLNFAIYIASSIYVAGEEDVMKEFGVSRTVATLGLSLCTVGYGLGPMLWSPLSEIPKIGRRGIYFWTLLAYILLQIPTGYAQNITMFLVFRTLTGFFGSPALATGGGTITDLYDPARSAYGVVILGFFGVLGPVFGPIVGGFLVPAKGWRWTIWVVTWLAMAVLALLFFCLPETSAANILYRRAKRLRELTGNERLKCQSEIDTAEYKMRDHLIVLGRAFVLICSEPIVFFLDLYTALLYGVLFTWFESFPLGGESRLSAEQSLIRCAQVFGNIYHFSSGGQGLVFVGILVGGFVTLPLFLLWVKYGLIPRFERPNFLPETVLLPTFFGAVTLPICLFWYGWTSRASIPWIVPVIDSGFFTVSIITLFFPVLNYLGMAYPSYVASIFAGNALFRALFGASFPLFARQLFETLGIGPGNSLLGGIAVAFMVLPFVFYRHGARIRAMSESATHAQ